NRVNEGAEALWLANSVLTQLNEDPNIGLLPQVFDRLRGEHFRPQFDPQKLVKIRDKVMLRRGISLAEALDVFPGEREEFHIALKIVVRSIAAPCKTSNASHFEPNR